MIKTLPSGCGEIDSPSLCSYGVKSITELVELGVFKCTLQMPQKNGMLSGTISIIDKLGFDIKKVESTTLGDNRVELSINFKDIGEVENLEDRLYQIRASLYSILNILSNNVV